MVKEIVFKKGESPLDGTLPQFVIVEFLEYCGPAWIKKPTKMGTNSTSRASMPITLLLS
jgi:hypothetical protein